MTGLSGFELTSRTGEKRKWTPTARASLAVMRPYSYAKRSSPMAPKAMVGGKSVPPPCASMEGRAKDPLMRMPGPPFSKSAVTRRGISARDWSSLSFDT